MAITELLRRGTFTRRSERRAVWAAGLLIGSELILRPRVLRPLRAKPGGEQVAVTVGNIADFGLAERFSLVFVVFNTLFAFPDQDARLPVSRPCLATFCRGASSSWRLYSQTRTASTGAND